MRPIAGRATMLGALVITLACRHEPSAEPEGLDAFRGRLATDVELLLTPGPGWKDPGSDWTDTGPDWKNTECGDQLWHVLEDASIYSHLIPGYGRIEDLGLRLLPATDNSTDNAIPPSLLLLEEGGPALISATSPAGELEFTIPAARLDLGIQHWKLRRSDPRETNAPPLCFRRVTYEWRGEHQQWAAANRDRLLHLGDFLRRASDSASDSSDDGTDVGTLMVGPRVRQLPLQLLAAGRLSVTGHNLSDRPTTAHLAVGEHVERREIGGGDSARFEMEFRAGARELRLETEGDPDSLFLWDVPELVASGTQRSPTDLREAE